MTECNAFDVKGMRMPYRTILVHCDAGRTTAGRAGVAADLAVRFGAHLVGIHVRTQFTPPPFLEGGSVLDTLYHSYQEQVKADEAAAAAAFKKAVAGRDLSTEWRSDYGWTTEELAVHARYADLVVVGQHDPAEVPKIRPADLPETIALSTGRPVLVTPHIGVSASPGKNILLCWNASREAARAASDAMPFLTAAEKVIVLAIDAKPSAKGHGAEPGADVAAWLARHGAKVTVQRDTAVDSDVGNLIVSRAADFASDMIVMGVYGHSRMREIVLGGASRTLLASLTVPALIAH